MIIQWRNGVYKNYLNPGWEDLPTKELYIDEVYRGHYYKKGGVYKVIIKTELIGVNVMEFRTITARAARRMLVEHAQITLTKDGTPEANAEATTQTYESTFR